MPIIDDTSPSWGATPVPTAYGARDGEYNAAPAHHLTQSGTTVSSDPTLPKTAGNGAHDGSLG